MPTNMRAHTHTHTHTHTCTHTHTLTYTNAHTRTHTHTYTHTLTHAQVRRSIEIAKMQDSRNALGDATAALFEKLLASNIVDGDQLLSSLDFIHYNVLLELMFSYDDIQV